MPILNPNAKNTHMQKYPPRPSVDNDGYDDKFITALQKEKIDGHENRDYLANLVYAYWATGCGDGYKIALHLIKECYATISREEMEELDAVSSAQDRLQKELEEEWLENNKITAPFKSGTKVNFKQFHPEEKIVTGLIENIYEYRIGVYALHLYDDNGHLKDTQSRRLIKFEDVWEAENE